MLTNALIIDIVVIFVDDFNKFFAKQAKIFITIKQLRERVSHEFHKYIDTWNSKLINMIFSHKDWDHQIDLQFEIKLLAKKAYELFKQQTQIIKKYIDDMFDKNFIKLNTSSYVASILIIEKFDEKFRVCVNYKALNNFIIKNRNVSSLIKDILSRLCKIKWYNKFDIIIAFNEICMRKSDEQKTIFLTRYKLFEYIVMSFDLCNALETFQIFINVTLKEYLNDFCSRYLDDILVYNETRDNHVKHVFKMLKRLQKVDLFLNIDKCEFFVQKMKYLKLIIIIDDIKMNFNKIDAIVDWKTSRISKTYKFSWDSRTSTKNS